MRKKYSSKYNIWIKDDDAQMIGEFLEAKFPKGDFQPADIVRVARPKDSLIHKYFEWDDTKAAINFRISQARKLIQSIIVEVEDGHAVPAYHSVILEDSPSYVETSRAVATPNLWSQVLNNALYEAESWSARYRSYKELGQIHKAIHETKEKLNAKGNGKNKKAKARSKGKRANDKHTEA